MPTGYYDRLMMIVLLLCESQPRELESTAKDYFYKQYQPLIIHLKDQLTKTASDPLKVIHVHEEMESNFSERLLFFFQVQL